MTTIHVIGRDGGESAVEAYDDEPLMYTLRDLDDGVAAICGGMCSCATCHVYVDAEWLTRLPEPAPEESDLLEELENSRENSRLSCQIRLTPQLEGLRVTLAPEE